MYLVYVDDSGDESVSIFSALFIEDRRWRTAFSVVRDFRQDLKANYGIFMRTEFHATDFVAGRGRIGSRTVPKGLRCRVFKDTLAMTANLPGAKLLNVISPPSKQTWAFERLLTRIDTFMRKSGTYAIVICDEGKESLLTRLSRRLSVYNPIPSRLGAWNGGATSKNIPVNCILDDLVFKRSERSYFIQLADFCGYALLRREVPIPSKTKYGLDTAFDLLKPICLREASRYDPNGIVRVS